MATEIDKAPAVVNFTYRRGDTVAEPVTILEAGAAANLTGRTYRAQLRQSPFDAQPAISFTVDIPTPAAGELVLRLSAAQTATLNGTYHWDLEQTVGGVVRTLLAGVWRFVEDVSRA